MKIIRYQPTALTNTPMGMCKECKQDFPLAYIIKFNGKCYHCYNYYYFKIRDYIMNIFY